MQECTLLLLATRLARRGERATAWLTMTRATCASHIYRKQSGRNSLAGLRSSGRAEARAKKIRLHPIRRFCGGMVSPLGKRQKLSFCRCRRDMRFLCGFPCGPKVRRVTCKLGRRRANGGVGSRGKRGSPNIISSWLLDSSRTSIWYSTKRLSTIAKTNYNFFPFHRTPPTNTNFIQNGRLRQRWMHLHQLHLRSGRVHLLQVYVLIPLLQDYNITKKHSSDTIACRNEQSRCPPFHDLRLSTLAFS